MLRKGVSSNNVGETRMKISRFQRFMPTQYQLWDGRNIRQGQMLIYTGCCSSWYTCKHKDTHISIPRFIQIPSFTACAKHIGKSFKVIKNIWKYQGRGFVFNTVLYFLAKFFPPMSCHFSFFPFLRWWGRQKVKHNWLVNCWEEKLWKRITELLNGHWLKE